ncbi:MAG: SRPBCC family protein [Betaproteobacteria bacterium]
MKSVIELEINVRQADVAVLLADPHRNPEWMDDIARIEAVGGVLGEPGSSYRLVPKRGSMIFVATVLARKLPDELRLSLDSPTASVTVEVRLLALSDRKTKLISEENFTFRGVFGKILGFLARGAIKRAHRRHMEAFKRLVEGHLAARVSGRT